MSDYGYSSVEQHSHREYADERHDHYDYADKHHSHYDLERLIDGLLANLNAAFERISDLERRENGDV